MPLPTVRRSLLPLVFLITVTLLPPFATPARAQVGRSDLESGVADALERITVRSLRGHLFFLASDELQGRDTPSPGLDIAARYLATQFERIGLEPAGDDGYFQTSPGWVTDVRDRTYPPRGGGEPRVVPFRPPVPVEQAQNPVGEPYSLRNVAGILRGSDPARHDSWILVTAHYDHVGIRSGAYPDSICNGANDNGSSTVALIELAHALMPLRSSLDRSILFLAVFGEEKGMLGSTWYVNHPLVPLEHTVGVLNLEQIGRTDGDGGLHEMSASFTGHDYSTLPQFFVRAGEELGVEVYKHEQNSDRYFTASDNGPFARAGIPAHTACTLFSYEGYHQPGDNPDLIDYENMARVVRMLALGLIGLATADEVPRWNESLERTAPFIEAWRTLTGGTPPPRP